MGCWSRLKRACLIWIRRWGLRGRLFGTCSRTPAGWGLPPASLNARRGERRIYSSAGFEILADAIGEESGIDFPDYLREAVFDPLGMRDTNLYGSAGHGATSTVHDLLLFVAEVLQPTLLDAQTVADAASVQFPELSGIVPGYGMFKPCPWGLGFEVKGSKGASREHWTGALLPPDTIGHFGQSGTFLWVHRPSMRAMAVLTDYAFGDSGQTIVV